MIRSRIISDREQDQYWRIVRRCLVEFHHLTEMAAQAKVRRLQEDVEALPRKDAELFFHAEPFDVACRITGQDLDVERFLSRYLEIRDHSAPHDD
jgi:hypothetical protein